MQFNMKISKPHGAELNTLLAEMPGVKSLWVNDKPAHQDANFIVHCTIDNYGGTISIGEENRANKDAMQYTIDLADLEKLIEWTRKNPRL
ncbi:hypothetical protein AGMMS49975_24420 [Clostridia bacterium]|nr:hypothetical protein AGMMS49975_24420 [Clostridia bacterium]